MLLRGLADFYRHRLKRFALVRVPKELAWRAFQFVRWHLLHPVGQLLWGVRHALARLPARTPPPPAWRPPPPSLRTPSARTSSVPAVHLVAQAGRRALWFTRWRLLYPVPWVGGKAWWFIRWRLLHPVHSVAGRVRWFARWRVWHPLSVLMARHVPLHHFVRRELGADGRRHWHRVPSIRMAPYSAAAQAPLEVREVFPAAHLPCPRPEIHPERFVHFVPPLVSGHEVPAVVLRTWTDAEVSARSNMVIVGKQLLHHDQFDFRLDWTSEELHQRLHILPRRRTAQRLLKPPVVLTLDRAAAFTDSCSANYAHWLTEVLPRMHAYAQARGGAGGTVIIDSGLHRNLRAGAELVMGEGAVFAELEFGTAAHVKQLDVVSPGGYIPFDRRPGSPDEGHSHGVFNGPALLSMRRHLLEVIGPAPQPQPRKVLVRRGSGTRLIRNEQELEDRLAPLGFVPIYPERLTFAQQVQLFASAEIIVGATGAAMTNLLFMPPGARIIILIATHPHHPYGYWQAVAKSVGHEVAYVLGPIDPDMPLGCHSDFWVDPDDIIAAIEAGAPRAARTTEEVVQ